ncbi:MAG: hypothetical protein IPH09_02145 [bacterium]|nr:hypothetical protein [bacterium]
MRLVVLFEDHTLQGFRPVAWSVPVYEIPCGLFNLRERVEMCLARSGGGDRLALLPRTLLTGLQRATLPLGTVCGAEAALDAASRAGTILFLNARLAVDWNTLRSLLERPAPFAVRDEEGVLAAAVSPAQAASLLGDWQAWEASQVARGAWTGFDCPAEPWRPQLEAAAEPGIAAWRHLWDLVPDLARALADDTAATVAAGLPFSRLPFGVVPAADTEPVWRAESRFRPLAAAPGVSLVGADRIWAAEGVEVGPCVAIDARHGPVVLDRGVTVLPHSYLEGPLYLGAGARVKAGAALYGETAIGAACRVAGEIAETQILPLANKQHAGFLGHAVVAGWVNLGADTTCSDLKNNYGEIAVNYGLGPVPTGSRFVGLMVAEHAKSAIGTTFNTGTTVGFASNVFGAGFPRSCLANFTWGDGRGHRSFAVDKAIDVAATVMLRRGCLFTPEHGALFRALSSGAA